MSTQGTLGAGLAPGLADPVHDAQAVFRAVLSAMAQPGIVAPVPVRLDPPAPLTPATAALCLGLLDFETSLWLDDGAVPAAGFLRFHTNVRTEPRPGAADFALVSDGRSLPALSTFRLGTDDLPERSATVIVQVAGLTPGKGWRLTGPGIDGESFLAVDGLRADVVADLAANRQLFPCGVDLVLTAGDRVCALPRTTRVEA